MRIGVLGVLKKIPRVSKKELHEIATTTFGFSSLRALTKEVGGADSRAVIDESGWKGRAQQIILLKTRVKQLDAQLRNDGQVRWGASPSFVCGSNVL